MCKQPVILLSVYLPQFSFSQRRCLRLSHQQKEPQEKENGTETRSFRFTNLKKTKVPMVMQMKQIVFLQRRIASESQSNMVRGGKKIKTISTVLYSIPDLLRLITEKNMCPHFWSRKCGHHCYAHLSLSQRRMQERAACRNPCNITFHIPSFGLCLYWS